MKEILINYILHLADNALIIGHRNSEWCGHGPVLEQDIAITNIALDHIGQARNFYQYAALLKGDDATEDSLAYLRTEREFKNCLLTEQPKRRLGAYHFEAVFFQPVPMASVFRTG
jgi:ring-1,2-phenylacetyl-CoA epoxidase subunit PaaC